jgi:hypothetical protein
VTDNPVTREEIDAKIGRAKAETVTEIVRLEGTLDGLEVKLDSFIASVHSQFSYLRNLIYLTLASVIASAGAVLWKVK